MLRTHETLSAAEYELARRGHLRRRQIEILTEAIGQVSPSRVLEIGSGTGALLDELGGRFPTVAFNGIDDSAAMIEYARASHARANVGFEQLAIAALPDACADFLCSIDVLHHVREPFEAFKVLRRALVPGGTWIAIEPNIWHPYVTLQIEFMRRRGLEEDHFRPWVMEPLLMQAGWSCAKRYAICVPASVQKLPRWAERAERHLERAPFLAGSVVYRLTAAIPHRDRKS